MSEKPAKSNQALVATKFLRGWIPPLINKKQWIVWGVQLRSSKPGMVLIALSIGAGAAGFAALFRWLIAIFTNFLSGYPDYSEVAQSGAVNPHFPSFGRYFLLVVPIIAGFIYGPIVQKFAKEARGHGVPEVMYAVAKKGGRIAPQVALVKALASALCIGGGGSVGREGPIVQIGSAIGSTIGQTIRASESRMRVFVACGAASGIGATFNTPLAGVFFAMELILRDFTTQAFAMVVISAVTSGIIGRLAFGDVPFLQLPNFQVNHISEYLLFVLLGVFAAFVGVLFTKALYKIEDICDWAWRWPEWLRPGVGGIVLGVLLFFLPEMYGVGYPVLGNAVSGKYAIGFLIILLLGKIVATSLTIGIGGSGGVFGPNLFIGAMLGAAFGLVAQMIFPGVVSSVGTYALLGMGATFAGSARAPITAVIMLFEMTGKYSIILPLMLCIAIASAVSGLLSKDTIYTLKLRRRGINIDAPGVPAQLRRQVGEVMQPLPDSVEARTHLEDAVGPLAKSDFGVLPVCNVDGKFLGVVTSRGVASALVSQDLTDIKAALITELPAKVYVDDQLDQALSCLELSAVSAVPVFEHGNRQPVGWITYPRLLEGLERRNSKQ